MNLIAGIDPGKQGAIAFLEVTGDPTPTLYGVHPLPRMKAGELDVTTLYHMIDKLATRLFTTNLMTVYLEAQWHGVGGKIVKEVGMILATCQIIGVPVVEVQPLAWKKHTLNGSAKGKDEQKAAMVAQCCVWGIDLPRLTPKSAKPHDGCADAVGIAFYGEHLWRKGK